MSGFVSSTSTQQGQQQRLVAFPMAKKLSSQDLEKVKQKQEIVRLQKLLKNRFEFWELTFGEKYSSSYENEKDNNKNDDDGSSVSSQNTHTSYVNAQHFESQQFAAYFPHIAAAAQMGYMGSYPTTPNVSPVMMQSPSPAAMYYYPHPDQYHQMQHQMNQYVHSQQQQGRNSENYYSETQTQTQPQTQPQTHTQESTSKTSESQNEKEVHQNQEQDKSTPKDVKTEEVQTESTASCKKLQIQIPQVSQNSKVHKSQNYAAIASKSLSLEKSDKSFSDKSDKSKAEDSLQQDFSKVIEVTRQQILTCKEAQIWIEKIYNFVYQKKDWVNFAALAQPQNGLQKPEACSGIKLKLMLLSDSRFIIQGDQVNVTHCDTLNYEKISQTSLSLMSNQVTYSGYVYAKPANGTHIFMNFEAEKNSDHKQLYMDQCIWLKDQKDQGLKNQNVSAFKMIDGVKYGQNLIAYRSKSDADIFDTLQVGDEVLFFIEKDGLKSTAIDIIRK
jgi:hypothetical protein